MTYGNLLPAGAGLVLLLTALGAQGAFAATHGQRDRLRAQFQPIGSRAALDGVRAPGAMIGRGADRGYSMYFSPQQDESYDGRF